MPVLALVGREGKAGLRLRVCGQSGEEGVCGVRHLLPRIVGVSLGQQEREAQGRGEKGAVHEAAVLVVKRNIERDRTGRYLKYFLASS
jgi:hypothetical protein